jgi:hypothetical protein
MKAGLPLLALTAALAACAPAAKAPPKPVASSPAPRPVMATMDAPRPAFPPALPNTHWMDAPLTPGAWRYIDNGPGNGKRLPFFQGNEQVFEINCVFEQQGPQILLLRIGRPQAIDLPMTIRSETLQRTLTARAAGASYTMTSLPAGDPLLDAMALSKGRFAVEVDGLPPLYLPSHAEVSRVIEDCR